MESPSPFDATSSLLGYLHQLRYALWQAIEASRNDILGSIAIEAADDVELRTEKSHSIEQLKHRSRESTLTDRSSDLWKTIRIWSSLALDTTFDVGSVHFRLITTGKVREGSIASMLSQENRKEAEALRRMLQISNEPGESNRKAYEEFRRLPPKRQQELVSRIEVIANSADIEQVGEKIEQSLALGFPRQHLATFARHLEGWWFNVCIEKLRGCGKNIIRLDQLDAQIHLIRQEFSEDSLPISREISRLKPPPLRYQNHDFVEQLRFIQASESRINRAITNYLKAFNQRSSWQRENLLLLDELRDYEDSLVEEWSIHFDQLRDILGDNASEEAKLSAARELYGWAEGATTPVIRERCTEPFVVRGSLHMMAHEHKIGWHPEFASKLMSLLDSRETSEVQ